VEIKRGTQILYVPDHAEGDIYHKDCEEGFVTSVRKPGIAFCRYWSKTEPRQLRTTANSENTSLRNLKPMETTDPRIVEHLLNEIEKETVNG